MASEWWDDFWAKRKAARQLNRDVVTAAIHYSLGSRGDAEARGRIALRHTTNAVHRHWQQTVRRNRLQAGHEIVSGFIQNTFDILLEVPPLPDGGMLTWAQLDLVFQGVAKILINRGDVELGPAYGLHQR